MDILLDVNYDGWLRTVTDENDSSTCSYRHVFVMREAAHAFGLSHAGENVSIMKPGRPRTDCVMRPYDVAAMMALYQSHTNGDEPALRSPQNGRGCRKNDQRNN